MSFRAVSFDKTTALKGIILAAILFCSLMHSFTQVAIDSTLSDTLEEVEISVSRSILRSNNLSASSHDVTKVVSPSYSINELTNRIAGIFTTAPNNFAQDSRITSRGFGARSAFGIRGIRIITDDFPDTSPDGQSQLDNIDFSTLKRIEFLRGPQSGLYGNNSGGVLNLKSFDFNEDNHFSAGFTYGSYGMKITKLESVIGNQFIKSKNSLSHINYNGYRTWSQFQNTIFNSITEYRKGNHQIKALINYANSPIGNDPGGVNNTELSNGRQLARPANELFQAGESVIQYKTGLKYTLITDDQFERFSFRAYGVSRHFENNLPFENNGAVTIDRKLLGLNADYNLKYKWHKMSIGQKIGIETEYQNDHRKQFQNLKNSRGEEKFNQNELFQSQSIYLLNEIMYNERIGLTLNIRNDNIKTKAADNFLSNGNQSGQVNNAKINYTLALNYFDKLHRYSLLHSTGFENPTLTELSNNPAGLGGFSTSLQPMRSINYEISINSRKTSPIDYSVNVYHITTTDEIIGYEIAGQSGRTYFKNQGNTTRRGIELSSAIKVNNLFTLTYQHNYLRAKYADSTTLKGKFLPGIPTQVAQIGLDINTGFNTLFQLENRYVSEIYLIDSNADKSNSYNELSIKAKTLFKINKIDLTLQAGVSNVLNAAYFSNFRINAVAGRYYETALPRNYFTSISLRF